jgi:hypothetical protein
MLDMDTFLTTLHVTVDKGINKGRGVVALVLPPALLPV